MKKIMILLCTFAVLLSLAACGPTTNDPTISADEALDIALNEVGVSRTDISDLETSLDEDNGRMIYEIDFNVGRAEYSFDINAENGDILSRGD